MRYPLIFDLKNRKVVFIGGGKVALRKAQAMKKALADIAVVAPDVLPEFYDITSDIRLKRYEENDITPETCLVFACTDSKETNRQAADRAKKLKIPVNIADDPEYSDFHTPSVITHGDFTISVSTDGKSPSASKQLRTALEDFLKSEK